MQEFTYPDVGVTRFSEVPDRYRQLRYRRRLRVSFEVATEALMTWQMHKGAGLRPTASASRVAVGVEVVSHLGPKRVPCRVVWVVSEPDRSGFAYGTLPGHPESGEESFLLERSGDGTADFTIKALTTGGPWYTRLAGPLVPLAQHWFARRYADALDRPG